LPRCSTISYMLQLPRKKQPRRVRRADSGPDDISTRAGGKRALFRLPMHLA